MTRQLNAGVCAAITLVSACLVFFSGGEALAGPPYFTDDPEPVELGRRELYLAAQFTRAKDGYSGAFPQVEVNYGAFRETQLHLIVPAAFSRPDGDAPAYGPGDTELGVKYRFLGETEKRPQAGVFPLLEIPTGKAGRGLGGGEVRLLLPVYAQKRLGPWTTYGGGGYWLNPGAGNRNWIFAGWLVQRDFFESLTLGAEVFHRTSDTDGGSPSSGFNAGGQVNFDPGEHLLFSAGRDLSGPNRLTAYLAFQRTF